MTITFEESIATFQDHVGVEEAESLLEWLLKTPKALVNLDSCQHLHSANLQVLMATKPEIISWPKDNDLRGWLQSALTHNS